MPSFLLNDLHGNLHVSLRGNLGGNLGGNKLSLCAIYSCPYIYAVR